MIFNFGSINIDHVYRVSAMPEPGETLTAKGYEKFLGGKGVNQSIAIQKAGGNLIHVGAVGEDGGWALDQIAATGVTINQIKTIPTSTGHAIIYVDDGGENQIVIVGGANQALTEQQVDEALAIATKGDDWVLLQNETNLADYIVAQAKRLQLKVVYSAAPFIADVTLRLMDKIDLLIVNEGEAHALASLLEIDSEKIPVPQLLITLGERGAVFHENGEMIKQSSFPVAPFDTTGAGDTFLGSFLARLTLDGNVKRALQYAAAASAIQITRAGAANAIPDKKDVEQFLKEHEGNA